MHLQPLFKDAMFITDTAVYEHSADCFEDDCSVSTHIFNRALCLPSGDALTEKQMQMITNEIKMCFE